MKTNTDKKVNDAGKKPPTYKITRRLTQPLFSMAHLTEFACVIKGPMEEKLMDGFGRGEGGKVILVPVEELETGNTGQLICSAVIESTLSQIGDYVGKAFLFRQGEANGEKKYRPIDVFELERQ